MLALLDLVSKLFDYGKQLAATLPQRAADNPYFAEFNYATNDLALVLAPITRGLLRAAKPWRNDSSASPRVPSCRLPHQARPMRHNDTRRKGGRAPPRYSLG
jgi:hypothetical protein